MKNKVIRLVEYQDGKQRNLEEGLEFLKEALRDEKYTHMFVIYRNEDAVGWFPASEGRNYKKSEIYWDVGQFLNHFLNDPEET